MELISTLFVIPVLVIALSTIYLVAPIIGIETPKFRYSSIDGFRGFLALFVFLHHSAIWYYFTHRHKWGGVPCNLYNHFGSTSVAFFFMITAFLFFSKLIDPISTSMDWAKLYISRIMRIMPLYVVTVFILVLIIGLLSQFALNESFQILLIHISQWMFFMEPDINKIPGTRFINSGVQWSLTYEWAFYCSLALIGWLVFRIKTSPVIIIFTIFFLAIFLILIHKFYPLHEWQRMFTFIPGIIGALVIRNEKIRKFCSSQSWTFIVIILFCVALFHYPTAFEPIPFILISIVFITIACGNTFFGLLTFKPALLLGQISYSIYLLHGFILFGTFYFIIGFDQTGKLPIIVYWGIITLCTVVVIITCSFTYYFIEKPSIESSGNIVTKIKQLIKKEKNNYLVQNR